MGHRVCTVGSEEAVMVWLLTDRCLAGGQMAADKCQDGEWSEGSKRNLDFASFFHDILLSDVDF